MLLGAGLFSVNNAAPESFTIDGPKATLGSFGTARLTYSPQLGRPDTSPTLQHQGTTWRRAEPEQLAEWLEVHVERLDPAVQPCLDGLVSGLDEEQRIEEFAWVGPCLVMCGKAQEAIDLLEPLPKTSAIQKTALYWLGRAHEALGDEVSAKDAYATYLKRSAKKASYRADADRRRTALGG